jgi:hypothetical protein
LKFKAKSKKGAMSMHSEETPRYMRTLVNLEDLENLEEIEESENSKYLDPNENGGRHPNGSLSVELLKKLIEDPNTEKMTDPETGEKMMKVKGFGWIQMMIPGEEEEEEEEEITEEENEEIPEEEEEELSKEETREDKEEEERLRLGKYAHIRLLYLQEYGRKYLKYLRAEGRLEDHLKETQEDAVSMLNTLVKQMAERDPPPDKATDQMGWVGHMNMTKLMAEEIVIRKFISS